MLAPLLVSIAGGSVLGFAAGLVPGLHMNNIAAAIGAYSGVAFGVFGSLASSLGGNDPGLMVSAFVCAALVAHQFGEAVTSTYVGIPAEDVVSVLPAHRLAKAGLGSKAVQSSADGSFAGVLIGVAAVLPICLLMGRPVGLYDLLKAAMLPMILAFSVALLIFEGFPSLRFRHHAVHPVAKIVRAFAVFMAAGALGYVVFDTGFYGCGVPDLPWIEDSFVPRSSLLLPMFAGLFGIPGLLLSLGSRTVSDISDVGHHSGRWRRRDILLSVVGGTIVGWLPGMTSGSAATLCAPGVREQQSRDDIAGSLRFIRIYASITSCGAVMSVGALFVIMRARSGSMDTISFFLNERFGAPLVTMMDLFGAALLAMLLAAISSRWLLGKFGGPLGRARRFLCSRELALGSLVFVVGLSLALTGVRGAMLMASAVSLGLVAPLAGVRRIQLMGSLLVPIALTLSQNL